jgi:callose synthase
VRLPGNPILGEGKPENQNHAIIFAHGEYLQTLDMNQDNYLGEAFKLRNLLELFRGKTKIMGFREHIISDTSGLVASFAASNEFVFGTMIQRFMTWPLMVRLHYGHPDVWDGVWAVTAGGVSKASKTIHVSEDIFGGANVVLRGGDVDYVEFVQCGKARDITFAGINQFEQKNFWRQRAAVHVTRHVTPWCQLRHIPTAVSVHHVSWLFLDCLAVAHGTSRHAGVPNFSCYVPC